ncbi:MAG: tRNA glutamyl-Q(34) synthetase GluQRS [Planctomycetes bacterium]|nr:tRNA glutamyl-Q(34) synthetase GluQRS [Planctomycetota bacterium]MCP4839548.1 tRNA glutamyl-Q(34) synthetase GluQRS [Planctomycetota bacterium]
MPDPDRTLRSRLAPSPTGALHLGNARTFAINWALARQRGWELVLRIEDLDHPRVKPETIDLVRDDLAWLGLDWDRELPLQSSDLSDAQDAMHTIARLGRAFPCALTRREVQAAQSAPHEQEQGLRYEPTLRPSNAGIAIENPNLEETWRFLVQPEIEIVSDEIQGAHAFNIAESIGDFPIWTSRGPAYQLAVAVDDARHGITDVVRGNDLLPSAARQQSLLRTLGLPSPRWWHVPLVRGEDGRRLAKRHGDTRLSTFRDSGTKAERVMALLGRWCGVEAESGDRLSAAEFAERFSIDNLPNRDITLTQEDFAWLT